MGRGSNSNSTAQRYEELALNDALQRPYDYPWACQELSLVLRLAYSKLSKHLQSLVFRDTLFAFQSLPLVQTGHGVTSANILLQAAEASLPKQKRALAVTEFKHAVVAYKRRSKPILHEGFLHFPEDVLIQIFGYLDMRSLVTINLVCRAWHETASENTLWKMLYNNLFGTCNFRTHKLVQGTANLSSKSKGHDAVANINWKEEFKSRYQGEKTWKYTFNRAVCAECKTIIWITSISSSTSHNCANFEFPKQKLRPISPNKVVDYLLGETELTTISSDSEDSDSDEPSQIQRLYKLWAYPKLVNSC